MISNMLNKIILGAVFAAGLLLASDAHRPLDDTKVTVSIVRDKKWTLQDLSVMAKSHTVADAVSSLTRTAQDTGASALRLDKIEKILGNKSAAELRAAIITATEVEGRRKSEDDKQIADFARTINPAATCATQGTAGGHGLEVCIAGCAETSTYLAWASRKGSCELLCTLATSPCDNWFFWGTAIMKGWVQSAAKWIAMPLNKGLTLAKTVYAWMCSPAKIIAAVAVALVYELWMKPTVFRKMRAHAFLTEQRVALQRRDQVKEKGVILARTHARLREKKALHALHDFAALATYRAAQEAEEAEAKTAKAVALNAAIEMVAAEQAAWDKDGGGCVVS